MPDGIAPLDVGPVLASYARCRERGGFVESFYERLWQRNPAIAKRFHNTDMVHQHQVMRDAINTLLMFARGSSVASMALRRISEVHGRDRHDISPELYEDFVEVLLDSVKQWDTRWEPELEPLWRSVLAPGISLMAKLY